MSMWLPNVQWTLELYWNQLLNAQLFLEFSWNKLMIRGNFFQFQIKLQAWLGANVMNCIGIEFDSLTDYMSCIGIELPK